MRAKTMGVCLPTELPTKMQKQTHHKKILTINKQANMILQNGKIAVMI